MPQHGKRLSLAFGATGGWSAASVRQALERGFDVRLFAQDSGLARRLFGATTPNQQHSA